MDKGLQTYQHPLKVALFATIRGQLWPNGNMEIKYGNLLLQDRHT